MHTTATSPHTTARTGSTPADPPALSTEDAQRLLAISVDLLAICVRVLRRVDPAVGAMIAYARDEVLEAAIRDRS
jgi:hypothetical protein